MRWSYNCFIFLTIGLNTALYAQNIPVIGKTFAYQIGDTLIYDFDFNQNIDEPCRACSTSSLYTTRFHGFTVTDKKLLGDSIMFEMKMLPSEVMDTFIVTHVDSPISITNSFHLGKFHRLLTGNNCLTECALNNITGCNNPLIYPSNIADTTSIFYTLSPTTYSYPNLDLQWGFTSFDSGGIESFMLTRAPFGSNNPFVLTCSYRLVYWSTNTIHYGVLPNINPVKVEDVVTPLQFYILPNPFKSNFNLRIVDAYSGDISAAIVDTKGQVIFTQNNLSQSTTIDLSFFADGVYFLKVSGNTLSEVRKLYKY